jgi:hypothetical protein
MLRTAATRQRAYKRADAAWAGRPSRGAESVMLMRRRPCQALHGRRGVQGTDRHAWAIDRADHGGLAGVRRVRPQTGNTDTTDDRRSAHVRGRTRIPPEECIRPEDFTRASCGLSTPTSRYLGVWNLRALRIAADRVGGICTRTGSDEVSGCRRRTQNAGPRTQNPDPKSEVLSLSELFLLPANPTNQNRSRRFHPLYPAQCPLHRPS